MAFDLDKIKYLNDLEKIEDWITLPNSDPRIIKLREMYGGEVVPKTQRKIRKKVKPQSRFRVKVTKDGVSTIYEGARVCSEELGIKVDNIYSSIATGYKTDGFFIEKLPKIETLT